MSDFLYIVDILKETDKRAKEETFFCSSYSVLSSRLLSFEGLYTYEGGKLKEGLLEYVIDLSNYSVSIRKRTLKEIMERLEAKQDV